MAGYRFPRSSEWRLAALALIATVAAVLAWDSGSATGAVVHDRPAAVSLELAPGWVGPLGTVALAGRRVDRLLVGTDRVVTARPLAACRAARELRRSLAAGGALVWVRERLLPSPEELRALPRAPTAVRLSRPVTSGCLRGSYRWRFRTGGRVISVIALVGEGADEATRSQVRAVVESVDVGSARVGRSREGRPIELRAAGDPQASMRILVAGCIHGDECASEPILERLSSRPARGVDLWLIPTLNPDGRRARVRQNAAGVDLNRNFPGTWRAGTRPGDRYYAGPRPASEPETRIAMRTISRLRPDVTIWFHQPEANVRAGGGSARAARAYARLVGLPYLPLPVPAGAATAWQTGRFAGSQAFVVELAPGRLTAAQVARHTRAVRALARRLRVSGGG